VFVLEGGPLETLEESRGRDLQTLESGGSRLLEGSEVVFGRKGKGLSKAGERRQGNLARLDEEF